MNHNEKSRNEDVYKLATLVREKEALSKSDVRSLQEKIKEMIEDLGKSQGHKENQLRNDVEIKLAELDRVILFKYFYSEFFFYSFFFIIQFFQLLTYQ